MSDSIAKESIERLAYLQKLAERDLAVQTKLAEAYKVNNPPIAAFYRVEIEDTLKELEDINTRVRTNQD